MTASGTCGNNLNWSLSDDGALTITGSGMMDSYNPEDGAPWADHFLMIQSVVIEEGVVNIGDCAFMYCENITSVSIPGSVASIGEGAFQQCSSLAAVTLPDQLTVLAAGTFCACSSLTSIVIPAGVTEICFGAFSDCSALKSVVIPSGVTFIDASAFNCCTSLTDVTLPPGLTAINDSCFQRCTSLSAITIPSGVTTIDWSAFSLCTGLSTIIFEGSLPEIKRNAFSEVNAVVTFPLDDASWSEAKAQSWAEGLRWFDEIGSGTCGAQGDNLTWTLYATGELVIEGSGAMVDFGGDVERWSGYASAINSIIFPEGITTIGSYAFSGCSGLTSVTIPAGVTSIGGDAFSGCTSLRTVVSPVWGNFSDCPVTHVTIPEGVTSIADGAFAHCSGLTSVTIPASVTSIGPSAFSECSSLTGITIPNGVTSIEYGAFYCCSALTSVIIPDGVKSIDPRVFSGCSALTGVTIPSSVTSIGYYAFYACSGLTSVTIPASVTSIGNSAFSDCVGLTSVTIPDGTTSIGNAAFIRCYALTSVSIPSTVTSIGNNPFYNCTALTDIWFGGTDTQWAALNVSYLPGTAVVHCSCTITYVANGGTGAPAVQNFVSATDGVYLSTAVPTRTGYTFLYWKDDRDGKNYAPGDPIPAGWRSNVLRAQWKLNTYTVKYNANGGTGTPSAQTKNYGQALTLSGTVPTRSSAVLNSYTVTLNANGGSVTPSSLTAPCTTSYTFKNWNTKANGSGTAYAPGAQYAANAALTLYAQWNSTTKTQSLELPTPTRAGSSFAGWSTSKTATTGMTGTYTPTGNVTLYAIWTKYPVLTEAFNSATGVRVSWRPVDGMAYYRLLRKNLTLGETQWKLVGETTDCTLIDKTAKSSNRYTYTVEAVDEFGNVSERDETGRTCTYIAKADVTELKAVDGGVSITWSKPAGAKNFRVMRKADGETKWNVIAVVEGTTYVDTTAPKGVKLWYTVRGVSMDNTVVINSYNGTGWSLYHVEAPVMTEAFNSSTGVRVSWNARTGAAKYRLLRKNLTKNETDWTVIAETADCSIIDKSAVSSNRYTYSVQCIDSNGRTSSAPNATGRTCTYIAMAKITAIGSVSNGIKLIWSQPAGAKNFRVFRMEDGGVWIPLADVLGTSYTDTTAVKGVKYWYTIRAITLAGDMYINSYNSYGWSCTR